MKEKEEREKKKLIDQTQLVSSKGVKGKKAADFAYSTPVDALKALRIEEELRTKGEDGLIDIVIKLQVKDAKKGLGQVRGLVSFPGGAVNTPKLCVFTTKENIDIAEKAGADLIGDNALIKKIQEGGDIPFEKCVATVEAISNLKTVARILGPKGLMPSNKGGTLVPAKELEMAIKDIKAGKMEFRINTDSTVRLPIGKKSYKDNNLIRNIDSVCNAVYDSKPEGVKKLL